jgi:xanthine dehydrogenase accessory factor
MDYDIADQHRTAEGLMMDSLDMQVLSAVQRWTSEGHQVALVTVARTWGSSPRPPGAWLALRGDGMVQGSVSGGCIEDDLITRMRDGRLAGTEPFALTYGVTKDEATRFGLPCGGTLELVVEPELDIAALEDFAKHIEGGQLMLRSVDTNSGKVRYVPGSRGDTVQWQEGCLTTVHGPRRRLLIIGAGQISFYLAQMALPLDYQVIVCDPRAEYSSEWHVPGTELRTDMPDDAVFALNLDPNSAVVALTHDPKLDDMALLEALKSPAFYVGALGSKLNNDKRRIRLQQYFDISADEAGRLHGPVGLPIGSRTPPEIAIAILAEMTAVKNGVASSFTSSKQAVPQTA